MWRVEAVTEKQPMGSVKPRLDSSMVLKECAEDPKPILTITLNTPLQTEAVPDDLKTANISAVFKKNQRYNLAKYRPVSLSCFCCKRFERIMV